MTNLIVPMNISWPPNPGPITQIQPFTYEDGITYVEILYALKRWIVDELIPQINDLTAEWEKLIADMIAAIDAKLADQNAHVEQEIADMITYVNEAVQSIINNSIEVQDPVVAGIMSNPASATRQATDPLYVNTSELDSSVADELNDPESVTGAAARALFVRQVQVGDKAGTVGQDILRTSGGAEGSRLTIQAHSYGVGVRSTSPDKAYAEIVRKFGKFATFNNRSLSGSTAVETYFDASNGINNRKWEPLTDGGIVVTDAVINCVQLFGDDPKGLQSAYYSLLALTALNRARRILLPTDPSITYGTAGWTVQSNPVFIGGEGRINLNANATVEFKFTGTSGTLVVLSKDAAATGAAYGDIYVSVDNGPEVLHTLGDKAKQYAPTTGSRYGTNLALAPYPIHVHGLHSGQHSIKVRTATGGLSVQGAFVGGTILPGILLVMDAYRPASAWADGAPGASNATLDRFNALLPRVADAVGGDKVKVIDTTIGWDANTMTDIATNDGKHPNDAGHAHYANAINRGILALGDSLAWNYWRSGEGYAHSQYAPWGA